MSDGESESSLQTVVLAVQNNGAVGTVGIEQDEPEEPTQEVDAAKRTVPPLLVTKSSAPSLVNDVEERFDSSVPQFTINTEASPVRFSSIQFDTEATNTDDQSMMRAVTAGDARQLELNALEALFSDNDLWRNLEDIGEQNEADRLLVQTFASGGVAISSGVVAWMLRGGSLMASLLTSLPAWKSFDPLPIIAKKGRDSESEDSDDNAKVVEEMFEQSSDSK